MVKFFDKASSSVLNVVRELFGVDKDSYLVPIFLYAKLLPSLHDGLKLIGLMKRTSHFTFGPKVPEKYQTNMEEYILCDEDGSIRNFSYGMTLDYGYFPKMFVGNSKNTLFSQNINIDALSLDFSDKN